MAIMKELVLEEARKQLDFIMDATTLDKAYPADREKVAEALVRSLSMSKAKNVEETAPYAIALEINNKTMPNEFYEAYRKVAMRHGLSQGTIRSCLQSPSFPWKLSFKVEKRTSWRSTTSKPTPKYEISLKREVVQKYRNGESAKELSKEYGMSDAAIYYWNKRIRFKNVPVIKKQEEIKFDVPVKDNGSGSMSPVMFSMSNPVLFSGKDVEIRGGQMTVEKLPNTGETVMIFHGSIAVVKI